VCTGGAVARTGEVPVGEGRGVVDLGTGDALQSPEVTVKSRSARLLAERDVAPMRPTQR
jgi:hypothetical protein